MLAVEGRVAGTPEEARLTAGEGATVEELTDADADADADAAGVVAINVGADTGACAAAGATTEAAAGADANVDTGAEGVEDGGNADDGASDLEAVAGASMGPCR